MTAAEDKTYLLRLKEAQENCASNSQPTQFRVQKFLLKELAKRRQQGAKTSLSAVLNEALHFALFGPHPFNNPIEGLRDAFEVYSQRNLERREIIEKVLKETAENNGIKVKFE